MYKINTKKIPKKIASGIVRFGFFISPPFVTGVSIPMKAKNKSNEAEPISLNAGVDVQVRFFVETKLIPTTANNINGINFPSVASSIKRTPFFTLVMLMKAMMPNNTAKKMIRNMRSKAIKQITLLHIKARPLLRSKRNNAINIYLYI